MLRNRCTHRLIAAALTAFVPAAILPPAVAQPSVPTDPEFVIHRPSNTGIPGQSDVLFAKFGPDGRLWVSARDQFWLQGGVAVFDGTYWTTYANWQSPLPQWNYDIEFAADGSAWIAGDSVVNHFDGVSWETFGPGNSPLPGDRNWDLDIDAQGHVWIANADIDQVQGGLYEYDGSSWQHHDEPFMRTYFGESVGLNVYARGNGEIWAGFYHMPGMALYNGTGWVHKSSAPALLGLAEDSTGTLYGTNGQGTYRYNDATGTWQQIGAVGGIHIFFDHRDWLWVADNTQVWNYVGGSWNLFTQTPSDVSSLQVRPNGDVWLSIKTQVRHYAPDGAGIRIYNSVNTGMPEYLMRDVYRDRDGQMWFVGVEGGVTLFDGVEWRNFGAYNGDEEVYPYWLPNGSLQSEGVEGVYHDQQDNIWLISNGIARSPRSDLANWTFWYWQNSNVPAEPVEHIAEDRNGSVWVGFHNGLMEYDGAQWIHHQFAPQGWTANEVEAMAQTPDGTMWVATADWTLRAWDGNGWSTNSLPGSPSDMAVGPDGHLWIATSQGLVRHDGSTFQTFTTANSGLTEAWVRAVAVRDDGLVAATCQNIIDYPYSGSVVFYDGTTWKAFTSADSDYPHHQSGGIEFDADGHLWVVNVNNGIVQVRVGSTPRAPGDLDEDGDVDLDDFNLLQSCLTGPGGGITSGCAATDLDEDGDVDLRDFGSFADFMGG